jgi:hypothetical protein
MVTPGQFRQSFKAFRDPNIYDDFTINMFIGVAGNLLDPNRWDTMLDYGTMLFVAHHLALSALDEATVEAGGIGGGVKGVLNSKSVDKVAAGYDTGAVTIENAGHWNMTRYGIEFFQLAEQFGSGGIQLLPGRGGVGGFGGMGGIGGYSGRF